MCRLAITGGIAEGKTTVTGYIRELGIAAVSADDISREVFAEPEVQADLRKHFQTSESIDPSHARSALASDVRFRRKLNDLTHPRILRLMRASVARVFEVPLLFEACLQGEFDRVWVVTCGPEEQIERLVSRLGDRQKASAMLQTQLPTPVKCAFADRIVRTNLDEASVKAYVIEAVGRDLA